VKQNTKQKPMRFTEAYKGSFMKAADLGGKTLRETIDSIQIEQVGDEDKVVVSLAGKDQKLVLNKTNGAILAESWGDDMDDWCGRTVLLKPSKTSYNGNLVPCIRVEVVKEKAAPAQAEAEDDINV
jgi:hypothetical protein